MYRYVVQERCFIGTRSKNQIEQENERAVIEEGGIRAGGIAEGGCDLGRIWVRIREANQ
jgi:hypothetical protein